MTPRRLDTKSISATEARGRRLVAEKYLDVATLIDSEDGAAINVCVGVAVLAGIAAADAICGAALGHRYSGSDHQAAADLLERVDSALAKRLRDLVDLKGVSHYGYSILSSKDRKVALKSAAALVAEARLRLP
ncbi:MAG: hypothetical protein ACOYMR_14160 [Ilumatobacteraceae bacterium]